MKLIEMIDLWTLHNPNKDFFDGIELHESLDKEALLEYLLLEYMYMDTVDTSSLAFHMRVINFFKIHKWNINKLCESMLLKYTPLDNYHINSTVETDRDKKVDTITDREQITELQKNSEKIGEESKTDTEKIISDKYWDEHDKMAETDVNFVSAFNDIPSPEAIGTDPTKWKYNDTEHDRQHIAADTDKEGTENITTNKNSHYDLGNKDTLSETDNGKLNEDITKNEITDEGIVEDSYKYGNTGKSYQSLIEEERKQAQFNIYKWIARHFCRELLISLW